MERAVLRPGPRLLILLHSPEQLDAHSKSPFGVSYIHLFIFLCHSLSKCHLAILTSLPCLVFQF